jgi:hypothetical protein
MKKFSLKSIQNHVSNRFSQNPATVIGLTTPQANLMHTKSCPEVPFIISLLQSLIKLVLPQELMKAFPGISLKQWFRGWLSKIIDDYNEISQRLNQQLADYKTAYFNWMESFMDMEHDENYKFRMEALMPFSDGSSCKNMSCRHTAGISCLPGHPVNSVITSSGVERSKVRFAVYFMFTKQVLTCFTLKPGKIVCRLYLRKSEKSFQKPQKISILPPERLIFPNFANFVRLE